MDDSILKKRGANFYGFERIDSLGKHHYQLAAITGFAVQIPDGNALVVFESCQHIFHIQFKHIH